MKNDISKIFHLQAFWIRSVEMKEKGIELNVVLKKKHLICPRCGMSAKICHQKGKEVRVKHSFLGNKTVYLMGHKARWKCFRCNRPFTEVWSGLRKWSRKTEEAELQILNLLKGKSFRQLWKENAVSDHEARYLLSRVNTEPTWDEEKHKKIISIGIDEHSFSGRDLLISVTNLSQRRLKAILPDDRQESLRNWIRAIPPGIKTKIKEVCIDMKELFATVAKEELPDAKIVLDHFHLIQDANRRLDEARHIEAEARRVKRLGKRWWFLKGRERLDEKHKILLDLLLEKYPIVKEFYYFKEQLRNVYRSKNKKEAELLLSRIISNMECSYDVAINQWAKTLKRWRDYILNYFDRKTTNAFTEGANNKIKMIKRMSFGFRNVETYIRKMMIAFIPIAYLGGIIWHTVC